MTLKSYIITRLFLAIPMILVLLTLIFFVLRVIPGDPVSAILGGRAPQSVIDQKRHEMGLDKPIIIQYFDYLGDLLRGNLGVSSLTQRPVWDELKERLPATVELTIFAFIISVLVGIFWGTDAAIHHEKFRDTSARIYAIFIYSIPVFWLGMIMQIIFGVNLHWLPISGRISPIIDYHPITGMIFIDSIITGNWPLLTDMLRHITMPAIALGAVISSVFLRMVRGNMILALSQDYTKAAKARGIKEHSVIYRHALKNAFVPIITVMGLELAMLLAGAVLTETTFSWNGIGSYLIMKIKYRDFMAIQGTIVVYAVFVVVISLLIDIINAIIDPRIRY